MLTIKLYVRATDNDFIRLVPTKSSQYDNYYAPPLG